MKLLTLTVAAAGTLAVAPGVAAAANEKFDNRQAAVAAGDPAGTGGTRAEPTTGVYRGRKLSLSEIKARAGKLQCLTDAPEAGGETRCYDTIDQALGAPVGQSARAPRARAATCVWLYQVHYQWRQWNPNGNLYGFQGRTGRTCRRT